MGLLSPQGCQRKEGDDVNRSVSGKGNGLMILTLCLCKELGWSDLSLDLELKKIVLLHLVLEGFPRLVPVVC